MGFSQAVAGVPDQRPKLSAALLVCHRVPRSRIGPAGAGPCGGRGTRGERRGLVGMLGESVELALLE